MEVAWIEYKLRPPKRSRGYGLSNLVGDVMLTIGTWGLWLIWVVIREVRR